MPTIAFDFNDFLKLLGRKISPEQFGDLLLNYAKSELEHYDKKTGICTIKLGDTNLPYLWSAEGLAILLRGVLGIENGIPKINVKKGDYKIIVDKSVAQIRPFIAAFVIKGRPVDEYLLMQLVQMQEKLSENFGRKRQKISIGLYKFKSIKWPLHYKAVDPESVRFVPLESGRALNLKQILEQHPKGKQYAGVLRPFKKYPIFMDDAGEVLSFPPIINSNTTGRVTSGDNELLIEVTGTDINAVDLAANIFAQSMHNRGFSVESVDVTYDGKKITTPTLKTGTISIKKEEIRSLLGLDLKDSDVKSLLEKARYDFSNYKIIIPHFRQDIMDPVDVIEDIAIMHGFNRIAPLELSTYTTGGTNSIVKFFDKTREIMVGFGYQEVFSSVLSNKELMYKKMNTSEFDTVEIENFMSENYSCVRRWLMPLLLDVLSKNVHVEYPQRLFEQGITIPRNKDDVSDHENLAFVSAHVDANYTEMRQIVDSFLRLLGVKYTIDEAEYGTFVPGRAARIFVNGKDIGTMGEVHPKVLENFGVKVPMAAAEIDLSVLFELLPK